jgi:hypothetical protein
MHNGLCHVWSGDDADWLPLCLSGDWGDLNHGRDAENQKDTASSRIVAGEGSKQAKEILTGRVKDLERVEPASKYPVHARATVGFVWLSEFENDVALVDHQPRSTSSHLRDLPFPSGSSTP